jgi:hypothetical protein
VDGDQALALLEVKVERGGLTYQGGTEVAFGPRPQSD